MTRSRFVILFFGLLLVWAGLLTRGFFLQVIPHENLSRLRAKQFETMVRLEPRRGLILDRNGVELAASVTAFSLFADPKLIPSIKKTAAKLDPHLEQTYKEILQKLNQPTKRFVWLDRRLGAKTKEKIEALKISGLGFVEEGKRIYPNESLLSQTLGFVGREGNGLGGLESKLEDLLRGEKREWNVRKDAFGRPLLAEGKLFSEQPGGANVHLTIDSELQYFLEQELQKAMETHQAERAMGIVLDAQSSEVLAIGSYPGFDANYPNQASPELRRNPVVMDAFEPGSTIKTFTIAAALREKRIRPNSKFYCEKGRFRVQDRWIRESDPKHQWEWMTVSQILEVSSNIGVTKVAFDLGQEKLRQAFEDFGFGEKTGIEIAGETKGILPPGPWRAHHFSNISFGHGVAVSPIQMVTAYATLANGGIRRRPTLIKRIVDSETLQELPPAPREERRVLDAADAATMRLLLTGVTSNLGTGQKARVPGFVVAGKTGTAQKVDANGRGYLTGKYISSFAGFVPAHDPKFVIYIAVDTPQKGYYGSDVAAPAFNRVAEFALRMWGITPNVISDRDVIEKSEPSSTRHLVEILKKEPLKTVPELRGLTVREVLGELNGQNIKVEFQGQGVVMETTPEAGTELSNQRRLRILLQ